MHSPFGNFEKFKSTDGRLVLFPHCRKALAAVYGSVVVGLERNLCLFAAVCANCSKHLAVRLVCILTVVTASLASLRLVCKAVLSVELLFACCEYEICTAVLALKGLVFEHFATSLNMDK